MEQTLMGKIFFSMFGMLCFFWPAWACGDKGIQEGLWKMTVRMEVAGTPDSGLPPATQTHCLKDAAQLSIALQQGQPCEMTDVLTNEGQATWKMKCRRMEKTITGTGKLHYRGDLFKGTIRMTIRQKGEESVQLIQYIEGKRIGECP